MHQELRQRALKLLARREQSRAELMRKLAPYGAEEDVAAVLDELQAARLQSDERYTESFIHTYAARHGARRLRQGLLHRGIAPELIEEYLTPAHLDNELARARQLWRRKFGVAADDARERARQMRYLQSRGFSPSIVSQVLRCDIAEDCE